MERSQALWSCDNTCFPKDKADLPVQRDRFVYLLIHLDFDTTDHLRPLYCLLGSHIGYSYLKSSNRIEIKIGGINFPWFGVLVSKFKKRNDLSYIEIRMTPKWLI